MENDIVHAGKPSEVWASFACPTCGTDCLAGTGDLVTAESSIAHFSRPWAPSCRTYTRLSARAFLQLALRGNGKDARKRPLAEDQKTAIRAISRHFWGE